ncbi:MAG: extracellular solute-binding protein [Planctomycetes bacterium]|nr:extracellular solute-binding protein [Planctomycetota bacterium]
MHHLAPRSAFAVAAVLAAALAGLLGSCGEDPNPSAAAIEVPATLRWTPPADLLAAAEKEVVLFCALDEQFSLPLVREFEKRTGVKITFVPDSEQNKTVGLVNRLLQEQGAPTCDVFWNNELAQTIRLANAGALAHYDVPSAASIPARWRDPEKRWCGFAARGRVFILNPARLEANGIKEAQWPSKLEDLADPRFQKIGCIARPLTGTTATHGTALFSLLGREKAQEFFRRVLANEIAPMGSNGATMAAVRDGRFSFGLTDTDDYHVAALDTPPGTVAIRYPDAAGDGALLIPNSACKIAGGPNARAADLLLDWVLSKEVEYRLAQAAGAQIPLRDDVPGPRGIGWDPAKIKVRAVDWQQVARDLSDLEIQRFFQELFRS